MKTIVDDDESDASDTQNEPARDHNRETKRERLERLTDIIERTQSGGVRRTLKRAANDWAFFSENGFLPVLRPTVRRCADEAVQEVVSFIIAPVNLSLIHI